MQYNLTNDFTKISETKGIFYARRGQPVEIVTGGSPEQHTGFLLRDDSPMYVTGDPIYARAVYKAAVLNVSPSADGGGGGDASAFVTESDIDTMMED